MARARLEGVLDLNNKPFIAGMNQAVAHGKKSGAAITSSFAGIGTRLGAALSVGAVLGAARSLGAFASEVKDLSDTVGMTTDKFQQYSFAVSQSGGSQEVFVKSMVAIQNAMEEAKNGTGKAGDAFAALGINLKDIEGGNPEQMLLMIADAMKESGGSGEAFAAVTDLIGVKIATKMVPSLKMGSDGFRELANSANIASKQAVEGAEAAQDAWDAFKNRVASGALNQWFAAMVQVQGGSVSDALPDFPKGHVPKTSSIPSEAKEEEESFSQGMGSPRGRAFTKAENDHADEMEREARALADFIDDDLKHRQELFLDIQKINEDTFYIERDANREGMSAAELIKDLTKERAYWLAQAAKFENDILVDHQKDAAIARQNAARIGAQIGGVDRGNAPQEMVNPRGRKWLPGEVEEIERKKDFAAFANFTTMGGEGRGAGGGLMAGGIQGAQGGLTSGGMGNAYGRVRSGDSARAKEAAAQDKREDNDPLVKAAKKTARGVSGLLKAWGAEEGADQ